jgi:hypothetical protein
MFKKIQIQRLGILLLLVFLPHIVSSQDNTVDATIESIVDTSEKSKGFILLPLLYYTPDTRFGFGAMGAYYFKIADEETGESTRLSYVKGLADYTQNKQIDVWSSWSIFLKDEKYIVKGQFRFRNFPDRFYGIGNNTPDAIMEKYEYDLISVKKYFLRKLRKNVFTGIDIEVDYLYNMQTPGPILGSGRIIGSKGGLNSGIGGVFMVDTRDNVINATQGTFFEFSTYYFGKASFSNFNYINYNLVYNKYFEISPNHVIATNTVLNLNHGNPPFVFYSPLGGDEILRGYAKNRYRDMNFTGFQTEYRFPVWWRFGMVVFGGAGEVFSSVADVNLNNLKYSYGGGLRFSVNKKERMNVRLDYGFGRNNQSFYLMITEAF